nr:hypothetical protein Iba_chr02bCG24430 [Ipomoea batatas]
MGGSARTFASRDNDGSTMTATKRERERRKQIRVGFDNNANTMAQTVARYRSGTVRILHIVSNSDLQKDLEIAGKPYRLESLRLIET